MQGHMHLRQTNSQDPMATVALSKHDTGDSAPNNNNSNSNSIMQNNYYYLHLITCIWIRTCNSTSSWARNNTEGLAPCWGLCVDCSKSRAARPLLVDPPPTANSRTKPRQFCSPAESWVRRHHAEGHARSQETHLTTNSNVNQPTKLNSENEYADEDDKTCANCQHRIQI